MAKRTRLIVVGGATASGKTVLAIELARHYRTEIISADSRQLYREMRIGNARPTAAELAAARHHFVADRSVHRPLTAGRFADEAMALIEQRFQGAEHLVVVGGGGLYLRALCEGLDAFPDVTEAARTQVQSEWKERGLAGWQRLLQQLDPAVYATVDRQNPRRLQRMLEVSLSAGKPYSAYLGNRPARPFDPVYFTTDCDRTELYDRINRRVDAMVADGLEAEARTLAPHRNLPVLQTVGYQEWWPYFDGEYDRAQAIERVKQNSRRYAKRQLTWFRRGELYRPVTSLAGAVELLN